MKMMHRSGLQEVFCFTKWRDLTDPGLGVAAYEAKTSLNYFRWNYIDEIKGIKDVEDRALVAINLVCDTDYEFKGEL